ncbi:MAG: RNA polymerase factor sigma-54 [Candidatus Alcyoniella australis]|nr:RNA polymerase factor sigma-54 [Candidatus Alcyoniella australis]
MALELRQSLKLSQQLIMTPQLQQAIKLLQLSRLELVELVQQEINENPVLETPEPGEEPPAETNPEQSVEPMSVEPAELPNVPENIDWATYLERTSVNNYRGGFEDEERSEVESVLTRPESLTDHLLWQIKMNRIDHEQELACGLLVGYIDDDGYLKADLAEVAAANNVALDLLESALARIHNMDPIGVGARDLRECLLIQLQASGQGDSLAAKLVDRHLPDLEKRNYKAITQALKVNNDQIAGALKQISMLEPKPGRPFGSSNTQYITPDIYVYKISGEFVIVLNDDGLPKLRVSNYYRQILSDRASASPKEREYIQDKLRSAMWLIRSIHQRQRTIYKVTQSIVKFQHEFFERGVAHLRPLILRDVAEDISMHESTISRVTTNKYVHTPQGIYELKYFFNSGISSGNGEAVASESVKNRIKQIVSSERQKKPFSDQEIVRILKSEDIIIARRTVTKYREVLGILSSTKRRKIL